MRQLLLGGVAALALSACSQGAGGGGKATVEDATKFMAGAEKELADFSEYGGRIAWVNATYITPDTDALNAHFGTIGTEMGVRFANEAARFANVWIVAAGTTTGMMLANIPAAFFGQAITRAVPLWLMRYISAAIYGVLGVVSLAETAGYLG